MDQEEPSLPGLPGVSWDEQSQTFSNNPRKRRQRSTGAVPCTSSDPAVFSSDDDPALDNYVEGQGRRKKRYVGSWFQQDPASSDSTFGEGVVVSGPHPKRTLARQLDSGVFLGSDGTDGDDMIEGLDAPIKSKLPQLDWGMSRVSQAELLLRQKIRGYVDSGNETIDLYGMDIEELSDESIAPLSQFTCIPEVAKDVAFEQREPRLKLYLGNNSLRRVSGSLLDLTNLTILSLRGNQLEELPQSIANLRNLEELNISQNRLRYLPVELLDLIAAECKLKNLIMFPNPFFENETRFAAYHEHFTPRSIADEENQVDDMTLYASTNEPPRFISRRLGRSQVQKTEPCGRIVSPFKFSDAPQRLPVDVVFPPPMFHVWRDSVHGVPGMDPRLGETRVPSMLEAILRSAAKGPYLPDLENHCLKVLPHIRALLQRAAMQKEIGGGFKCSECRASIVVPAMEWVEWRDLRYITWGANGSYHQMHKHSDSPSEMALPFMHRACSSRCGPLVERAHWEKPPGIGDGSTICIRDRRN